MSYVKLRGGKPTTGTLTLPEKKEEKTSLDTVKLSVRRALARKPRKGRRKGTGMVTRLPPPLHVIPVVHHTYRFVNTSSVSQNSLTFITRLTLGGALGCICTVANSTVQPWAGSAKIHKITVWPAAGGTAGVAWVTGTAEQALQRDDEVSTDIPTGVTVEPKPLVYRPDPGTYTAMWQSLGSNSSDSLIGLYGTAGSVWDLDISYTLSDNAKAGTQTVASATLGGVYYLALDGPSGHNFVPQGLPTTS